MLKKTYFLLGLVFIHNYCLTMQDNGIPKFPVKVSLLIVNAQESSILLAKYTERQKRHLGRNENELYSVPYIHLQATNKGFHGCAQGLANAMGMQVYNLRSAYESTIDVGNQRDIIEIDLGFSTRDFAGIPTVATQDSEVVESYEWVKQGDLSKAYASCVHTNEQLYNLINAYKYP